ncbi:hypothetical protein [Methanolapillus africanus]
MVPTTIDMLLKMLKNEITMYEAFRGAQIGYKIKEGDEPENDISTQLFRNEIKDEDLPVKGIFFELDTEDIVDYIHQLEEEKMISKKKTNPTKTTECARIPYGIKFKKV